MMPAPQAFAEGEIVGYLLAGFLVCVFLGACGVIVGRWRKRDE